MLALALGVFVGGIVQVVMQVPALLRMRLVRWPRWNLQHEAVRRIARLMGPAIIGSSMGQLSVMLSTAIASLLADGSMTWLFFADRLVEFPLGVFSIALATVILPSLSAHHAKQTPAEFSETLAWALRLVCLIVIPASVAMLALAGPLTVVIYHRGKFTGFDVDMTQRALMAFSLALLGWSLIKVLAHGLLRAPGHQGPGARRDASAGPDDGAESARARGALAHRPHQVGGGAHAARADEWRRSHVECGAALRGAGPHGHHPSRSCHARPARAHRDRAAP